jgi:hypothetical protein
MVNVAAILLGISLILLIIYGLDTMVASNNTQEETSGKGFLPMDEAARGGIFGGGAVILSIIGFIIGRKERSKIIPILLIVNGSLIILGMIIVMAMNIVASSEESIRTITYTMSLGAILIALGIVKIIKDKKRTKISN